MEVPSTPSSSLHQVTPMYPNIKVLIAVMFTLPVTSCSTQRSLLGLRGSKHFQSPMITKQLTGLTFLHIHRDTPVDISAAVDEFPQCHHRKLQLSNILVD